MKSAPTVHQLNGVVWTPDDLNTQGKERGQELDHSGHAVAITLPQAIWKQFNSASTHPEGLATLIESNTTGEFYLGLLVQVGGLQLVLLVPMSSALARTWCREAVNAGGEFRLAVTIVETGELVALNGIYDLSNADAQTICDALEHIEETPVAFDAATHFLDLCKAVAAMSAAGADMTLVPGVSVGDRWVVTVGAADWPPIPANVAADSREQNGNWKMGAVVH